MSSATLEQQKSVDKIDELKKIHATIDTPEVVKLLKDLHASAEPYAKKMLDSAVDAALKNADSTQVALAFRGFAETIQRERKAALDKALAVLVKELDFGQTTPQA
jgi:hypothetical protein